MRTFMDPEKVTVKFTWKRKFNRIAKDILKKNNGGREWYTLLDTKTYHRMRVGDTACYCHE